MTDATNTPDRWPGLEAHIRARLARGAIVTRQGDWVQTEIPGGSIAWARTVHFDRATYQPASDAVAVLPDATRPQNRPDQGKQRRVGEGV